MPTCLPSAPALGIPSLDTYPSTYLSVGTTSAVPGAQPGAGSWQSCSDPSPIRFHRATPTRRNLPSDSPGIPSVCTSSWKPLSSDEPLVSHTRDGPTACVAYLGSSLTTIAPNRRSRCRPLASRHGLPSGARRVLPVRHQPESLPLQGDRAYPGLPHHCRSRGPSPANSRPRPLSLFCVPQGAACFSALLVA